MIFIPITYKRVCRGEVSRHNKCWSGVLNSKTHHYVHHIEGKHISQHLIVSAIAKDMSK